MARAFRYLLEVYVDDFIALVIPTSWKQIRHVANGVMFGIHDVFPEDEEAANDPISARKLQKGEGLFSTTKCILGFNFDGEEKSMWLEDDKRSVLLGTLHKWLRGATRSGLGIPLVEFESVTAKLRHAFTALPEGRGLLSPCNWVLRGRPATIYLHRNKALLEAIHDVHFLLRQSTTKPTRCRSLVAKWPDYVGIVDASSHGVGGIILGEGAGCPPTVFRLRWPPDVTAAVVSFDNPKGSVTNSDLEMAGLLLLWLCVEGVCGPIKDRHIAMFSDNSPTVSWVERMATRQSRISAQLVRALALRLNITSSCPLTPVHIPGEENTMADIASRSFGSNIDWHCPTDRQFLTFFNNRFPLPSQVSWNVFQLNSKIAMRVISALRMTRISLGEWQRLPKIGRHIGQIGSNMSGLWEWTHTFRGHVIPTGSGHLLGLPHEFGRDTLGEGSECRLARSLALSRPLDRRSPWPAERTQRN